MTEIERKALALLNEMQSYLGYRVNSTNFKRRQDAYTETICRAIEAHEAFRQEVSDALKKYFSMDWNTHNMVSDLHRFIIPKPDPLHECLEDALARNGEDLTEHTDRLRAALEARGLEIREKGA